MSADVIRLGDKPDLRFLSAREKFNLLPAQKRHELLSKMSDEDAARLHYDWEYNGRPKQLAPDYDKSRATSFCMCRYMEAQSKTDTKLKLEQFPSCTKETMEVIYSDQEPDEDGWSRISKSGPWMKIVTRDEPKVCNFRVDWSVWLLLAGRGFGKTRVGAELVRHMVETGQSKRIHIIAPTAADARDVAIEGESGLLNISPPWNKPLYESTKRRITWPNGATASLFSAEEPERLRGPQCDFSWCLIGETLVETEFGQKPIRDVNVGDLVWTRKGLKKVYDVQMTGRKPVLDVTLSNGVVITGTAEHKLWVEENGWLELQNLFPGAKLLAFKGDEKCQSFTKEFDIVRSSEDTLQTETVSHFTELFTKITSELFQTVSKFTTKMVTSTITTFQTSNVCQQEIIRKNTNSKVVSQLHQNRNESTQISSGQRLRGDISSVKTAEMSSTPTQTIQDGVRKNAEMKGVGKVLKEKLKKLVNFASARNVRKSSSLNEGNRTVLTNATKSDTSSQIRVLSVTPHSSQQIHSQLAQKNADTNSVFSLNHQTLNSGKNFSKEIRKNGSQIEKEVWNLSVEDAHEYFANGVLVKNCDELAAWDPNAQQMVWDMMSFGLRLGKNPRSVVTTTPKPTILIQQLVKQSRDPEAKTIITTGSTYENRTNLAAPFMRQITQYEGTNLGRQEIYAELIDIEESGILKRSWFKKWPAKKEMPFFEYVIQSYDTAFTEKTENDPTGCLVLGIFRPDQDSPHCAMILDCWTEHLKYPELRKKATDDYKNTYGDQEAPVDILLIEDKGSGIPLIQDLQRAGLPVRKYNPGRPDKVMRLHAVSHLVYNGRVYIPESKQVPGEFVTWSEDFLREVCSFPNSAHDEYVDTLSQGLALLRDQGWISVDPDREQDEEEEEVWGEEYSNPYCV